MRMFCSLLGCCTICVYASDIALGTIITLESFDSPIGLAGRVLFDAAPNYDGIENSEALGVSGGDFNGSVSLGSPPNGQIASTTSGASDQSGTGYFLSNWTQIGTASPGEVWGTSVPIAVQLNTAYQFSFYMMNFNNSGFQAEIQPFINGVSVGSQVDAGGATLTWVQRSFTWNSGVATTADFSLRNNQSSVIGNDFGIDTIQLSSTAVPEPSTLFLLGAGSVVAFRSHLKRRKRIPANGINGPAVC